MRILVGDVGGTNVRFACARRGARGGWVLEDVQRYEGDAFADFEAAVAAYLRAIVHTPDAALFGVAGPIDDNAATLTNRCWRIDGWDIASRFDIARVVIRNDFEAMARAAPELPDTSFRVLRAGRRREMAPILVAGPGTGFGLAVLAPDPPRWRVIGGEGGHQAYAAQTPLEWAVAQRLAAGGFVSVERVAAGVGYGEVFAAVRDALGLAPAAVPEPAVLLAEAAAGDPAALAVCRLRAAATLDACADGALAAGARGGVVIAGGVAQRLAEYLCAPDALARFDAHGPMSAYLAEIDIRLLVDPDAPLIGAAALFADLAR